MNRWLRVNNNKFPRRATLISTGENRPLLFPRRNGNETAIAAAAAAAASSIRLYSTRDIEKSSEGPFERGERN